MAERIPRKVYGISEIRTILNFKTLLRIKRSKQQWFGYMIRMPQARFMWQGSTDYRGVWFLILKNQKIYQWVCAKTTKRQVYQHHDLARSRLGVEPSEPSKAVYHHDVLQNLFRLLPPALFREEMWAGIRLLLNILSLYDLWLLVRMDFVHLVRRWKNVLLLQRQSSAAGSFLACE